MRNNQSRSTAKPHNEPAVSELPKKDENESVISSADKAESKAAKLKRDPNLVENKYATAMSVEQAKEVEKKYSNLKGDEVPPELQQAREVLSSK